MSELSRLTDAHLRIDGGAPLSAALIAEVNKVSEAIENSVKDMRLLVEVVGAADTGAELWPSALEIHTVNKWEQAVRRLERLPAVTVAVVDGLCHGPALDLVLATDYRIATPGSTFRSPAVGLGTWPGMSLYRLANQLGLGHARRLGLLGLPLSAAEAVRRGLLDELSDAPAESARSLLGAVAGLNGKELSVRRQLLAEAASTTFENAIGSHLAAADRALRVARTGVDSTR